MQADACLEAALLRWRGGVEAGLQASSRKRRRALGALLGVAGMACAAWPAWQMWSRRVLWQGELASATGVQRSLELPDGSVLRVDAASRVALTYRADLRQAQLLEGAAFFAVARDAARPFVVEAGPLRVTVLGTRFGVELEPDAVRVQVESGQVRVEHAATGRSQLLQDSQSLRIPWTAGQEMPTALPGSRSSSNGPRPGARANWSSSRSRWAASCTVWAATRGAAWWWRRARRNWPSAAMCALPRPSAGCAGCRSSPRCRSACWTTAGCGLRGAAGARSREVFSGFWE